MKKRIFTILIFVLAYFSGYISCYIVGNNSYIKESNKCFEEIKECFKEQNPIEAKYLSSVFFVNKSLMDDILNSVFFFNSDTIEDFASRYPGDGKIPHRGSPYVVLEDGLVEFSVDGINKIWQIGNDFPFKWFEDIHIGMSPTNVLSYLNSLKLEDGKDLVEIYSLEKNDQISYISLTRVELNNKKYRVIVSVDEHMNVVNKLQFEVVDSL